MAALRWQHRVSRRAPSNGDSDGGSSGRRVAEQLCCFQCDENAPVVLRWMEKPPPDPRGGARCHGKNHKDAASVRATHPIPAACGIYYFEVKIVSKGRDGGIQTFLLSAIC
uniref:Uncharacterized protein n=1 Tax=Meleagris gallopavo TaxID=9103 RepID=A0A803XLS0_MELGA